METLIRTTVPQSRYKKLQKQLGKINIEEAALGLGTTNYDIKQSFEPLSNAKPGLKASKLVAEQKRIIKNTLLEQKKFHEGVIELKDKVHLLNQRTLTAMEKWLNMSENNSTYYHASFVRMIKNLEREAQRSISLEALKKEKSLTLKRTIIKCSPSGSRPAHIAIRSGSLCFYQKTNGM